MNVNDIDNNELYIQNKYERANIPDVFDNVV